MNFTILNMSDDSNKGDLAILESTVLLTKKFFPQSKISVFLVDYSDRQIQGEYNLKHIRNLPIERIYGSFFPRIFQGGSKCVELFSSLRYGVVSLWMLFCVSLFKGRFLFLFPRKFHPHLRQLSSSDIVIVKGGSYIFSYGGIKQFIFLYRMLFPSIIATSMRKKIIALGHSIGPIKGKTAQFITKIALNKFNKVVVREQISYNFVTSVLGISADKIILLPDMAFWFLDYNNENSAVGELERVNSKKFYKYKIGLTIRNWHFPLQANGKELFDNYLNVIKVTVDKLIKEYDAAIYIMPHVDEDKRIAELIMKGFPGGGLFMIEGNYSTRELRKLYGQMDIFIGTRIHSIIFALCSGVPSIAIAYEIPKGFGIVSMVEKGEYIFDISMLEPEKLWVKLTQLMQEREDIKLLIQEKIKLLREQLEKEYTRVFEN